MCVEALAHFEVRLSASDFGIDPFVHSRQITLLLDLRKLGVHVGVIGFAHYIPGHLEQAVVLFEDVLTQPRDELLDRSRKFCGIKLVGFTGLSSDSLQRKWVMRRLRAGDATTCRKQIAQLASVAITQRRGMESRFAIVQ